MDDVRLACSTLIYRDLDISRALDLIAADGFALVDLCIVPSFCPHFDLERYCASDIEQLSEHLGRHDLSVVSLNVIPGHFNAPGAQRVSALVRRSVDLAVQLGAKIVTLPSGRRVAPSEWEQSVQEIGLRLREAADYAEQRGIVLSVEAPHWGTLAETVEEAARFFEKIDSRVKCTFDTSHVFREETTSLSDGLKQIGVNRVNHIHLRDALGEDVSFTPGKGHADFHRLFNDLRDSYLGHLCLELEFHDLTVIKRRAELQFAKRYVESLMRNSSLPLSLKVQSSEVFQFFERVFRDPKQELTRHHRIIGTIRKVRPYLRPLMPIRIYDGYWRNKWYLFDRDRLVVQPADSVPLSGQPPRDVRVCIQGCGYAGTMHGFGFQRLAGVKVVGVCDIRIGKAQKLAYRLKCAPYQDLGEMIEVERPDLVAVCTKEWQHYESVVQLLKAGIDVFCEKILATRYSDAEEMVKLAWKQGRVLGVNYNYRFMPGIRKLWEIVQRRPLGELQLLDIKVHGHSYHHALDLVSYLGGQISQVYAHYTVDGAVRSFGNMDWSKYDPDILYGPSKSLVATFSLAGGAAAVVSSSCLYPSWGFILSIDAVFDEGIVALSGVNVHDVVGRLTTDRRIKSIDMDYKHGVFARGYEYCFYKSIESFMNAYVLHQDPETLGEQGLFIMRLERALHQSNESGQKVTLGYGTPSLH